MDKITYELPLSEQIRVLIRLESLLRAYHLYSQRVDRTSLYLALKSLDDILSIVERNNIKKYLSSELHDLAVRLTEWRSQPEADTARIDAISQELQQHVAGLSAGIKSIAVVGEIDFVKNFRQRVNVAGGVSLVDFPRFHFWLQQDYDQIQTQLETWEQNFSSCYAAIRMVLKLIRQSAVSSEHVAEKGFYQETLDKKTTYKLMRVSVPAHAPCFAEVSGGKYHITVRMVQDDWQSGTSGCTHDIQFVLEKCRA